MAGQAPPSGRFVFHDNFVPGLIRGILHQVRRLGRLRFRRFSAAAWKKTSSGDRGVTQTAGRSMGPKRFPWSLHDPLQIGSLPKIKGSWTISYRVLRETPGLKGTQKWAGFLSLGGLRATGSLQWAYTNFLDPNAMASLQNHPLTTAKRGTPEGKRNGYPTQKRPRADHPHPPWAAAVAPQTGEQGLLALALIRLRSSVPRMGRKLEGSANLATPTVFLNDQVRKLCKH